MKRRNFFNVLLGATLAASSCYITAQDPFAELESATGGSQQAAASSRSEFEDFVKGHQGEFRDYKQKLMEEFNEYKRISAEETERYRTRLETKWDEPELSSKKVWVEYSKDLSVKNRVDFENQSIEIATNAGKNGKVSEQETRAKLKRLLLKNQAEAFKDDPVAQAVEKKSKEKITLLKTAKVKPKPILMPLVTEAKNPSEKQVDKLVDDLLKKKKTTVVKNKKGENVVKVKIDIKPPPPSTEQAEAIQPKTEQAKENKPEVAADSKVAPKPLTAKEAVAKSAQPKPREMAELRLKKLPKRAREVSSYVETNSKRFKLKESLVFAIIETESAFNPMAKSPIPAYGLMQIVPESAGIDATEQLFGKGKILSPSYLYTQDKNIEIGTTYLNILFFRYLKGVKDPTSRLYCVIAAYNTGAGNVAKAFTGKRRIGPALREINRLSPQQVYDHLIKNLPYEETQKYLKKVVKRIPKYSV